MTDIFYRDPSSKALINQSATELEAYKKRREHNQKVSTLEHDINTLKGEFEEIKSLLRKLINKD